LKIHWFLPGLLGALCLAFPAEAGSLSSWRFDQSQNRLEFTTDEGVQPRAQLVPDPTRLVIDLPGTVVGQSPSNQAVGGAIRSVRIGQLDAQTTRIVVELAPGYTLDPGQVKFRGLSPTQWTVQLPTPQPSDSAAIAPAPGSAPDSTAGGPASSVLASSSRQPQVHPSSDSSNSSDSSERSSGSSGSSDSRAISRASEAESEKDSMTEVEGIQVIREGVFVQTSGAIPEIEVERSSSGRTVTVNLRNAELSSKVKERERSIDSHGVRQLNLDEQHRPPAVAIKLRVSHDSPDWQAVPDRRGGILLSPKDDPASEATSSTTPPITTAPDPEPPSVAAVRRDPLPPPMSAASASALRLRRDPPSPVVSSLPPPLPAPSVAPVAPAPPATTVSAAPTQQLAIIQGVELDPSGNQLLIQSDRPVSYQGGWQSGLYRVTLSPAHLASRVSGPQLNSGSPLLRVRLRQENSETVVVSIQPATGVRFGSLNMVSPQMVSLAMERSQPLPPRTPSTQAARPLSSDNSNIPLPSIPSGRLVVILDPGHGGGDVGAVGIGGIHEADIVLSVAQQVGALLARQGVQTYLTRNDDTEIDLEPRVQMAEQVHANLFVSIHANSLSMDRPDVNGIETYYYESGAGLAQVIQNSLVQNLGMNDRGIRTARFYVIRRTTMPSVLVEIGYVTGSEDAAHLSDPNFRSRIARSIASGILQYIQQNSAVGGR
jgi:N-acetylmuramoyl-L-alanine amidase